MAHTRVYRIWRGMISRCTLPDTTYYSYYGGRGISVCERWLKFENFLADMGDPSSDLSIDRIDSSGNYEPANCRWATKREQTRNKRSNCYFTFDGETKILNDWCEIFKIDRHVVRARLRAGMSAEDAFKKPTYNKMTRLTITAFGRTQTVHQWSKETGIGLKTLKHRASSGWPGELAVTSVPTKNKVPWKKLVANG